MIGNDMPIKMMVLDLSPEHEMELYETAETELKKLALLVHTLPRDDAKVVKDVVKGLAHVFEELEKFTHVIRHVNKPALIDATHDAARCIAEGNQNG